MYGSWGPQYSMLLSRKESLKFDLTATATDRTPRVNVHSDDHKRKDKIETLFESKIEKMLCKQKVLWDKTDNAEGGDISLQWLSNTLLLVSASNRFITE